MNIFKVIEDETEPYYCEDCDEDAYYTIDLESNKMYLCKSCLTKFKNEIEKLIS